MRPFRPLHDLRPADIERLIDAIERRVAGERVGERVAADGAAGDPAERPRDEAPEVRAAPARSEDDRRQATYQLAQRALAEREERVRQEDSVIAPLLQRLREELPSPPQQVLTCRGAPGAVIGGRFRIRNASSAETAFAFRPRFTPPAWFNPARLTLAPGASAVVDVRIDLAGHSLPGTGREVLLVDVCADGRAALKLWIDLELDHAPEPT